MHYQKLASLALVVLLVGSGSSVAASVTTSQSVETVHHQSAQADQSTQTNQTGLTALEAVELVQNETDGTAIGVRPVPQSETTAFNVTVLSENLSVSQLTVSGDDPAVTATNRNITVVQPQFLGGEAFAYDELRSAGEAIRLIENETNGTVIQLSLRRGQLVYGVALRTPGETQTQALVSATEGPILGIQTTRPAPAPTANATTTAE